MAKKNKFKKFVSTATAVAVVSTSAVGVGTIAKKVHDKFTPSGKKITIQAEDTLYDLAEQYYGNGIYYKDVARKNKIDPDNLHPGDVVYFPGTVGDGVKLNTVQKYVVQHGDNLTTICEKLYKDGSLDTVKKFGKWNDIENLDHIREGQVLDVPLYEDLLEIQIIEK